MTQHLHQLVRDMPTPKATSTYRWNRVTITGFMCYCKKCYHRVDKAGIIPEKCPNCGGSLESLPDTHIVKESKYSSRGSPIYPLKCPGCKMVYDPDVVKLPGQCPSCGYDPRKDLADNVGVSPVWASRKPRIKDAKKEGL